MRRHTIFLFCLLFGVSMLTINMTHAVSRTVSVAPGEEEVENIGLKVADEVSGKISVVGDSSDDINFFITDPDGKVVVSFNRVSLTSFRFKASKEGIYTLHFDNTFSAEPKTVTFNYDVRHYIFGIPQEDFLVFIVMIVAVAGLILFVALSHP